MLQLSTVEDELSRQGYFSLFDLGLGRSITKLVAEKLGDEINYWIILEIIIKRRYGIEE